MTFRHFTLNGTEYRVVFFGNGEVCAVERRETFRNATWTGDVWRKVSADKRHEIVKALRAR